MKIGELVSALDRKAPPTTAEDWDNVGLLIGDPAWKTTGAVISVDLTEESLELAAKKGYSLIINHHPCIFPKSRGLSRVTPGSGLNALVFRALSEKIAVYCTHTNFDRCALEVPRAICEAMDATVLGRLHDHPENELLKLAVFVPETHAEAVRSALFAAGAGQIGNYDCCSFGAPGEGTFRGDASTQPFLGKPGKLERARELRLETILPRGLQKQVVAALLEAHPYEEVAYDLYSIERTPNARGLTAGLGYGFWAEFPKPLPYSEFQSRLLKAFGLDAYVHTVPLPKAVRRFGFVAGKGASFVSDASARGCDVFVTGEAGYHAALGGKHRGMAVLELGHRESERYFLETVSHWLKKEMKLPVAALDLPVQRIRTGTLLERKA